MGIVFGCIPGLTAVLGVTLMIPFTYTMTPVQGLTLLVAIYVGGISGGIYNIYGYNHDKSWRYREVEVSNCYSYCTLTGSNLGGAYAYNIYPIAVASTEYSLTVKDCYYLKDTMTYVNTQYMNGVSGKPYDELSRLTFTDASNKPISDKADANHTYPYSATLKGQAYPFPAFVKKADGTFVHYGDWPLKTP